MKVFELAEKLSVRNKRIRKCLLDVGIEVVNDSKLTTKQVKMVKVLLMQPALAEDVAKALGVPQNKLMEKLVEIDLSLISHLSPIGYEDRVKLLKKKDLFKLKKKSVKKKEQIIKKKKKPKLKRVYEVAEDLGVSENALLKKLQTMQVFAIHRRSPLEPQVIKRLKEEGFFEKKKLFDLKSASVKEKLTAFKPEIADVVPSWVIVLTIVVLLIPVGFNMATTAYRISHIKGWQVKNIGYKKTSDNYSLVDTVALIDIKKTKEKLTVVEEGISQSSVIETLVHKSNSPLPGDPGDSILIADKLNLISSVKKLANGDTFVVKLINQKELTYQVSQPSQNTGNNSNNSNLVIKDKQGNVLIEAILKSSN
ncbi:MAG: hypothetical protein C4562_04815 [Actinobacteria bacterium]|nr:MAG: hypothetical protein C4562_04815 [Actinomycetota bacterium]